ncbi:MAG: glycosyl hydrolase family 18 protein [Bacteroides intestinalis]
MAERVNGRVALGYVTYYGKMLPDPTYMTHINYAFAELYVKNNVYQKFDLQGDKERFNQVKKLKERNSNLKILFLLQIVSLIPVIPKTVVSPPWQKLPNA